MSVDLPAPLSPSRAWISPGRTAKSTPPRAWNSPNRFTTFRTSATGFTPDAPFTVEPRES